MTTMQSAPLAINGGKPLSSEPVLIHKPMITEEDIQAVTEAIRSTFVSGDGPACREFEKQLSAYLGVKHVLFLNSCTTALDLAFMIKDFPAGSEVIVPNFTYTSTALGPILNNMKIVLADVRPDNGNLDVQKLESYITEKTVAICPVDYAGNPAEMDEINALARKYGLYVVQDSAQSIGSKYKGLYTGNQADVSTFSFHGTKNMTTGEGGAIVTNDDTLGDLIKVMREKGTDKYSFLTDNVTRGYYEYVNKGNSYVQSNINGAMGVTQLARLNAMNAIRKEIAEFYLSELTGIEGLDFLRVTEGADSNWHLFGILVPAEKKYWIMDALRAEGVMCNVHYTPLHRNRYYKDLGTDEDFPGSMQFFNQLLRLPIYPSLTQGEREIVAEAVRKVFSQM
ncbi:MAG: DegT/DnrJ/EryC1/StrS aminotransferase family protein [Saprospiraceae bacterium]|nr:DegT/DnrJ/EryC1/StrS aminotransferase family protein [Saprospiraceae bacterium]MCB9356138.1 DegT/DnrJ/EryC1/StrS aminotransferase family protein [Lewinellaceae bacterium]